MSNTITGHTGLICLLGNPISHSISPAMHNASFDYWDLDYTYLAFETSITTLSSTVETLKNIHARGWNLTMPVKSEMCPLCDTLSSAAKISNSVNVVVSENGILHGHTTDGIGFMRAAKEVGFKTDGGKITLLGTGGAGTSILVQAALDGVSEISVFNRPSASFNHCRQIIESLHHHTGCKIKLFDYSSPSILKQEVQSSHMLVNGTSVGMAPNTEACLIPDASYFHKDLIVSDIIYNPRETKLIKMASASRCVTFNGLSMLLYQGAEAFRLWTGKEMPIDLIKSKFFHPSCA
ncbi:MAG: quinate/shikimate dehydrogenase [Acetivibrio sp.]